MLSISKPRKGFTRHNFETLLRLRPQTSNTKFVLSIRVSQKVVLFFKRSYHVYHEPKQRVLTEISNDLINLCYNPLRWISTKNYDSNIKSKSQTLCKGTVDELTKSKMRKRRLIRSWASIIMRIMRLNQSSSHQQDKQRHISLLWMIPYSSNDVIRQQPMGLRHSKTHRSSVQIKVQRYFTLAREDLLPPKLGNENEYRLWIKIDKRSSKFKSLKNQLLVEIHLLWAPYYEGRLEDEKKVLKKGLTMMKILGLMHYQFL